MRLHAYQTGNSIANEVFVLEKNGRAAVIEPPCFFDSIAELTDYLATLPARVEALLASYHMAGATFLPGVPVYSTKNADTYGHTGGGKALIDNFARAFGAAFDSSVFTVTNILEGGPAEIAGIRLEIIPTPDAFDIEILEMGAVYIHMLGHDCHSIVAGAAHADAQAGQLRSFIDR